MIIIITKFSREIFYAVYEQKECFTLTRDGAQDTIFVGIRNTSRVCASNNKGAI